MLKLTGSSQKGFTLLEILVVMSIIAIAMGLIVINLNPGDERRELRTEVKRFEQLLKLLVDESIFKQKELGIRVYDDKVSFYEQDERTETWIALAESEEGDDIYEDYIFPAFLSVDLEMGDIEEFFNQEEDELELKLSSIDPLENYQEIGEEEEEFVEPDIYIFSSGEVTAFELEFSIRGDQELVYLLSANDIGEISCFIRDNEDEPC